jgi:hypothetical protein
MFRASHRSSLRDLTVFAASGLYTKTASLVKPVGCFRFVQFSFGVLISVFIYGLFGVYKFNIYGYNPETANKIRAPDDERCAARNMLKFQKNLE